VIRSYADFLRDSLDPADDRRVDVDEILTAASRASALTRQLLAFSRKQVIQPRTLDLNAVVRDIEPMLRRLIGEEIELGVMLHPERVAVRADPGQLEQVIINLAVNARDAMSQGGVLGIETDVATLTSGDIRRYVLDPVIATQRAWPGDYAVIRVTDTGGGIDDSVLGHIFEPFFTTKGEGRGTGLGLATVHGIVAQAAGHVRVRTSAAEGTSFEILLPRLRREDSGDHLPVGTAHRPHGKGTILLVEDEVTVRRSVKRMLERAGYTIHEARHGADALLVWNEHEGGIDLLLTDLRMPELGGRELIAALHARDPELAVIAMSGYPPEMGIDPMGALAGARPVQFLAKPFSSEELLGAVESALRPA
jgi:CheY-like chemotaxis protein